MASNKSKTSTIPDIHVSSKVFYPAHGAGHVITEKKIEFMGEQKEYYEFEFINSQLTVSTPVQNIEMLGIRPVLAPSTIKTKIKELKKTPSKNPKAKDYNKLIDIIKELDLEGDVDAFVEIIQYCNHVKKQREKEGRLIPVSINKYIKNSVKHLVGELAVSSEVTYEDAMTQFEKITGVSI